MPNLTLRRVLEGALRNNSTWEGFFYDANLRIQKMSRIRIATGISSLGLPWRIHKKNPKAFDEDVQCALWYYWKREA
jgi:hypothetical protein